VGTLGVVKVGNLAEALNQECMEFLSLDAVAVVKVCVGRVRESFHFPVSRKLISSHTQIVSIYKILNFTICIIRNNAQPG